MRIRQLKKAVPFSLLFLLCIFTFVSMVQAEEKSITDCLNKEENCFEEGGSQTENQEEEEIPQVLQEKKSGSLFITILKMIFALLFILALIYGILLLLKRKNKLFKQTSILENIGGISVGPNKSIQILQIGSAMYIVGVGNNVELLQEITDETTKQELLEKHAKKLETPSVVKDFFARKKAGKQDTTTSFLHTLQQEMATLKKNRKNRIHNNTEKDDTDV